MHSHKSITIVTSPSLSSTPLPGCISPTTKGPVQYRIEERSRTVYVSSDLPPSEWDSHSLNQIFSIAELSEGTSQVDPRHTTFLGAEAQTFNPDDSTKRVSPDSRVTHSSRNSNYRSRRDPMVASNQNKLSPDSPPSRKSSPLTPSRPRILFYHKHDPHYGFTNFSDHPVIYKGKKYPTSEHLFQSFKVSIFPGNIYQEFEILCSFRNIARTWENTFAHARKDQRWHFQKRAASNLRFGEIGSK